MNYLKYVKMCDFNKHSLTNLPFDSLVVKCNRQLSNESN